MPDYAGTQIYTVVNDVNDILYVGSATVRLPLRMNGHKAASRDEKNKSNLYVAMRTIGAEHFRIKRHHVFPCASKAEAEKEEYKTLQLLIDAGNQVYNMKAAGNKPIAGCFGFIEYRVDARFGRSKSKWWAFRYTEDGVGCTKKFSVRKYGFWQAKLLAEEERKRVYPAWRTDEEVALNEMGEIDW